MLAQGERQPDFLVIYLWATFILEKYRDDAYVMLDGTPRSENEAKIMDTVFPFLGRKAVYVLFLDVSKEESARRLLARGRNDDTPDEIETRLGWYDTDVVPAVEYLSANPWYTFLHINGEQSREGVFKEIIERLGAHGFPGDKNFSMR